MFGLYVKSPFLGRFIKSLLASWWMVRLMVIE